MRPCILTCWRFYLLDAGITDPPPLPGVAAVQAPDLERNRRSDDAVQ